MASLAVLPNMAVRHSARLAKLMQQQVANSEEESGEDEELAAQSREAGRLAKEASRRAHERDRNEQNQRDASRAAGKAGQVVGDGAAQAANASAGKKAGKKAAPSPGPLSAEAGGATSSAQHFYAEVLVPARDEVLQCCATWSDALEPLASLTPSVAGILLSIRR